MNILSSTVFMSTKMYNWLIQSGNYLQPILLLIFRLHWGWILFITGKGKLSDHAWVVGFFTELGIPAPGLNAWFVSGLECFGGLLLLVGLCSRPIALLMSGNMLVAYLAVSEDRAKLLSVFSDSEPFLAATPFFFLLTSILVLSFGPGLFSIDELIKRHLNKQPADSSFRVTHASEFSLQAR